MSIKKLLKEGLKIHKNRFDNIGLILTESFNNTNFIKNDNFITESTKLLMSHKDDKFLSYLYESAGMFDDLLNICVLTFSAENSKLGGNVATFSLPAGWTCPFAKSCLKKVERERYMDPEKIGTTKTSKRTGDEVEYKGDVVVKKGKDAEYDCFAANQEMQYDAVRANRWHNFDLLQDAGDTNAQAELIIKSLNYFFDTNGKKNEVRIHESGDFYNGEYLKAWMTVAKSMPKINFYAYTKSIPYVKAMETQLKDIPNLSITLSEGGRKDDEIKDLDIKEAKVFNTPEDVLKAGLIIDLDDTLAKGAGGKDKNFALLVHGTQEKGEMSQNKMRNEAFTNYWKYMSQVNNYIWKDDNRGSSDEEFNKAKNGYNEAKKILDNKQIKGERKNLLEFLKTQLNYVMKYRKYNFNDNLIAILPEKYRPNK
jgi:hypothetical protein